MKARPMRQRRTRANHERWLVSYADFITLLFAFFVVLYASSQSDQKRAAKVSNAIEQAFEQLGIGNSHTAGTANPHRGSSLDIRALPTPGVSNNSFGYVGAPRTITPAEAQSLRGALEASIPREIVRSDVGFRTTPEGFVISLREVGFFESGSANMRTSSIEAFARIAAILRSKRCVVRVEGHTDPVPIHTSQFASNWELSTARATGLVKRLIQDYGIVPSDLSAGGYAEFHPVAPNDSPVGRALNRRVDLVILSMHPGAD